MQTIHLNSNMPLSFLKSFNFFFNWDSLHSWLNSHYEVWSYKKKYRLNIQEICLEITYSWTSTKVIPTKKAYASYISTNQGSNFLRGSSSNRDNVRFPIQFRRECQPQHLKGWFFLGNKPIHFHINSTSVIRLVKRNQSSFSSIEINKPLSAPVQLMETLPKVMNETKKYYVLKRTRQEGIIHLLHTQNLQENYHFSSPETPGGLKC